MSRWLLLFTLIQPLPSHAGWFRSLTRALDPFADDLVANHSADLFRLMAQMQKDRSTREAVAPADWRGSRELLETTALGRQVVHDLIGDGLYPDGVKIYRTQTGNADGAVEVTDGRYAIVVSREKFNENRFAYILAHEAEHISELKLIESILKPETFKKVMRLFSKGMSKEEKARFASNESVAKVPEAEQRLIGLAGLLMFTMEIRAHRVMIHLEDQGLASGVGESYMQGLRNRLPEFVTTHYIEVKLIPLMTKEIMHDLSANIPDDRARLKDFLVKTISLLYPEGLSCAVSVNPD